MAHSRGGQFARACAVRRPDLVHGLITLGSPLNSLIGGVHPLVKTAAVAFAVAGTAGVPGLIRSGCLHGRCCRGLRQDLVRSFPPDVPFLSVFSRMDSVVDWRSSLDPDARHRHVTTTHLGLLYAFDVLAEELIRLDAGHRRVRDRHSSTSARWRGTQPDEVSSRQAVVVEQVGELGAGADPELAVDPSEVHFDGLDAEEQLGGDLTVGGATGGEAGDL